MEDRQTALSTNGTGAIQNPLAKKQKKEFQTKPHTLHKT